MVVLPSPAVALFERQFGTAARFQLLQLMTEAEVDWLVSTGYLERVQRGVYRVRGGAAPAEQAPMAAVLRARPTARVTGPFVLGILGIDGFSVQDPFEILTAPGRRLTNVDFPHRRNPTPDAPNVFSGALPIVDPTAAVVDTGRFRQQLGDRRIRLGFDAARWRSYTTQEQVVKRAQLLGPEDPGAALFLEWFDEGDLTPESDGERQLGYLICLFDPPPESQVDVLSFRLDWYWRLYRLGMEYFGSVDHTTAEARLADTERFRLLRDAGIKLCPVVHADLADPDAFLAWVRSQLVVRAVELGLEPPILDAARR